jgi:lipoic acid synthetase
VSGALRVARLETVGYEDALALQQDLHARRGEQWLLLLEHPHVYTLGVRARDEHVLVEPSSVGADLVRAPRGGDVTYHGPGQLVGYPIVDVPTRSGSVPAHVAAMEQIVIGALADVGLDGGARRDGYPGVWIDDRKIAACGVRIADARSMHGFAVNVDPDLTMFEHIVPCGIHGIRVTSLAAEGHAVSVDDLADAIERRAAERWGDGTVERRDDVRRRATPARC